MRPFLIILCPYRYLIIFFTLFFDEMRKVLKTHDTIKKSVDNLLDSHHLTHSRQSCSFFFSVCFFECFFSGSFFKVTALHLPSSRTCQSQALKTVLSQNLLFSQGLRLWKWARMHNNQQAPNIMLHPSGRK